MHWCLSMVSTRNCWYGLDNLNQWQEHGEEVSTSCQPLLRGCRFFCSLQAYLRYWVVQAHLGYCTASPQLKCILTYSAPLVILLKSLRTLWGLSLSTVYFLGWTRTFQNCFHLNSIFAVCASGREVRFSLGDANKPLTKSARKRSHALTKNNRKTQPFWKLWQCPPATGGRAQEGVVDPIGRPCQQAWSMRVVLGTSRGRVQQTASGGCWG